MSLRTSRVPTLATPEDAFSAEYDWTEWITHLTLSKYFYVSYVMPYMPITYFYSPKIFLCKTELSRDFEYVVLCAPKSAANSRLLCSVHLKVLQIPGLLCSVHLKVLQFPGHDERGTSLGKKTGDPLHSHYVEKFQKIISM